LIKLISDLTTGQLSATGKIQLDNSIGTPVFLSLFGGNVEAVTTTARKGKGVENKDYFGNIYLQEEKKTLFNSKFEKFLKENPLTSGNLITLKQYALEDLEWMIKNKSVKSFDIVFQIMSVNSLKFDITAYQLDKTENKYSYLWSR
jgi:phage gp46-like protein